MSFVLSQFFQGSGTAVIEQVKKKTFIGKKQAVEILGHGKDSMEVRSINDIRFPGINPPFFVYCLAAGTVTISAGVIVNFSGTAVFTDCLVSTQHRCLTS